MVIVDGRRRQHDVKLFQKEGDFSWDAERFRVCLVLQTDEEEIMAAETIKLSQLSNSFTAIVRKESSSCIR